MKASLNKILILTIFLMVFFSFSQNKEQEIKQWEENFNLGYNFYNSNQFTQAETYFKKAVEAAKTAFIENAEEPITTLYFYANCKFALSQFDEALKLFKEVLTKAQKLPERNTDFELKAWSDICTSYSTLGNYDKAISEQEKLNEFIKDKLGEQTEVYAANVNNLGQLHFYYGDNNAASNYYYEALHIFQQLGVINQDVAILYNNLGLCYFSSGNYVEADNVYLKSFELFEELKLENTPVYSKLLHNIATLGQVQGDYANAKILHEQSLSILFNLNLSNTIDYAEGLFGYGTLLKDLGKYDNALYEIKNAKKAYDKFLEKDHIKYASINSILAEIHLNNGNTKEALKLYQQAAQLFKEKAPNTNPGYGYALIGLGTTYQVLGDYNKALESYLKGKEHLKISLSETHKDYGITIMNIAAVNADLGNYEEAFAYYEEAIDIIANSIGTQNTVYGQLCLGILGVIHVMPDLKVTKFEELIDTTLSIFKANAEANNLLYNYSLFYKALSSTEQKDYTNALDILLKIEKELVKDIEKESKLYNNVISYIAFNYHYLEDYDNAYLYYKKYNDNIVNSVSEVFSFRSEKDKKTYLKQIEYWFSEVTSISVNDNFYNLEMTTLSLNNQLLRKGLLLNSSKDIITQLSTLNNPDIDTKIKEYKSLKDVIIYMELLPEIQDLEELKRVESDLNRFETELVELYSSNFQTDSNFKKDWKTIKAALKQNEVAIEFVSYVSSASSNYIAYIITNTSEYPEVVQIFKEQELKDILSKKTPNQLYATRGSSAKSISDSKAMYDVIWKPIEQYVQDAETIYYSPVGLLNQIPFAALNAEGEELLSIKHNLVQLSSTSLLSEAFSEPVSNNTLFAGGIDYEFSPKGIKKEKTETDLEVFKTAKGTRSLGATWSYLPGTLSEINELQQLFSTNNKSYSSLSKSNATEENIKALSGKSPSVLHIATHGFFFENLPQDENSQQEWSPELVYTASDDPLMRSGLILAGANYAWTKGSNPYTDENGILTALEISNLDLSNTDMVVLSACETGLGDIDGSEGVYGLQRAFKMAGVDIIVMSLWEVPDKETAEFMNLFYSNWLGGMKIREAFNQTQRKMSNIYKDTPEKWAAFVLFE